MKKEIKSDKNISKESQNEMQGAETTSIQISSDKIQNELSETENNSIPGGLVKLKKAYPDFIESIGVNYLIWKDGTKMIYDDKKTHHNFDELLCDADLEDQMLMVYPKGKEYKIPKRNFDPGRVRNEKFFRKMYGNMKHEVEKNIVPVKWLPNTANKTVYVTSINGVDKKISAISDELEKIPDIYKYIDDPADSFKVRMVNKSNRLSMHSFGIVIDINKKYLDFWLYNVKWHGVKKIYYRNNIPMEIVEIFEKHGFIWGGKWNHFETIHFEYRPELLID